MTVASQPTILLLSADRRELRRWGAALEPIAAQLWYSPDDIPADDSLGLHPLVVVTDGPDELASQPKLRKLAHLEHGLVRLGSGDSSQVLFVLGELAERTTAPATTEVDLPLDVSARELALVCRLLGEIVLLRRAIRASGREREQLREQALTDDLTGLPNRRAWEDALAQLSFDLDQGRLTTVVALFDLDHFKQVNDRQGHTLGDAVLRAAGQALVASIRRHDSVARLGGDEFGLILTMISPDAVPSVVERLRMEIACATGEVVKPCVTVSGGYALATADTRENTASRGAHALVVAADAALRLAKAAGRDRALAAGLAEP